MTLQSLMRAVLTLSLGTGCYAYGPGYTTSAERTQAYDQYGPYGPRYTSYYGPGLDYGRPQGPNDHPLAFGTGLPPPVHVGGSTKPTERPR